MNQIVYLTDVESGIQVEATLLRNPTALRLQDTETIWRITQRTLLEKAREREEAPVPFVEHGHWDWAWKYSALKRQGLFFGVEREGLMQGLMFLRFDKRARLAEQRGRTLVYIDYLEAAPWNLAGLIPQPRFRGVGSALLEAAVRESRDRGWEGRVGLHSLPQAELFYRRLGLTDLGIDARYQNLRYFEMSAQQAILFLEDQ